MRPIVIIGAGLAGYSVARELRKLDPTRPLTLVAADGGDFYSKPMLSNALALGKRADELVTTPATQMAAQLALELRARTSVHAIDLAAHRLHTDRGSLEYDRLVCALGAEPIRLALAGDAQQEVITVNSLGDYALWRERLQTARRIAIVGAGLIGCEFANDLAAAGYRVTVIDPSPTPLSNLLPEVAGKRLMVAMASLGVEWRLGAAVTSVERAGAQVRLSLAGSDCVMADRVLSAVGLRPRTRLAAGAGLTTRRGIVVDASLRASDPDVFALGDCAQIEGEVRSYVLPIMHAARALARTLTGDLTPVRFPPMPVAVKTPCEPVIVAPAPRGVQGAWQVESQSGGLRMAFRDADDALRGFVLTGARVSERAEMTRRLAEDLAPLAI